MKESYKERNKSIKDQAETLRMSDFSVKKTRSHSVTRVISFTSGKGGAGKTSSVVNLAVCLARLGKSVLILDADLGLANVDVMLGLQPKLTLNEVIGGRSPLDDIILDGPEGISIIPSASGVESICNLDADQRLCLMQAVEEVASRYDYLLIDTRAGISPDVMQFNSAAGEIICVINAEPTSLTDAYAMIKVLARNYGERSFSILANNIFSQHRSPEEEAKQAFLRLQRSVDRFLKTEQVELKYLGYVPHEKMMIESIKNQQAVVQAFPSSSAGLAFAGIGRRIDEQFSQYRVKGGMQFFFRQLLEVGAYGG